MEIVDILIFIIILFYIIRGFKNGAISECITSVGGLAVIIIAYYLKNPLSVYLYEHLPFFNFGGLLNGISVLNILIYELISFLIVASILMVIYKIILAATNIIEKIIKITIIFELPSKIIGSLIGFVEGIVITFIMLFILVNIPKTSKYITESKYGEKILTKTPVLGKAIEPIYNSIIEIHDIAINYKDSKDRNAANLEALDTMLKYKVIEVENAESLVERNKLKIKDVDKVIDKYKGEEKNDKIS